MPQEQDYDEDTIRGQPVLLEVRHVTQYHYAEFVRESVMELWMQPQKAVTQRLLSFELEARPPPP